MRVLVTRPAEDGAETALQLAAMGHQALLAPLLTTHFFDLPPPALEGVQAILATSANGVRAFARLSPRRDLPLYAVGPQTFQAAVDAQFAEIGNADGDASALAEATAQWTVPQKGELLHVSGEQGTGRLQEILTQRGFTVRKAVLYRVDAARELPSKAVWALTHDTLDAALFFSPRSARVFAQLTAQAGHSLQKIIAMCISTATADALAGEGAVFKEVRVAGQPNQKALLEELLPYTTI